MKTHYETKLSFLLTTTSNPGTFLFRLYDWKCIEFLYQKKKKKKHMRLRCEQGLLWSVKTVLSPLKGSSKGKWHFQYASHNGKAQERALSCKPVERSAHKDSCRLQLWLFSNSYVVFNGLLSKQPWREKRGQSFKVGSHTNTLHSENTLTPLPLLSGRPLLTA